jgi:hypothetical protein
MYLLSVTELFLPHPHIYLTTGGGAPMYVAVEAAPLWRLCDVHLKSAGGEVPRARRAWSNPTPDCCYILPLCGLFQR